MSRSNDVDFKFTDGRTKQEFREDVNINNILEKWLRTGQTPKFMELPGQKQSVDISAAVDFHTAMSLVKNTERIFSEFSSKIRNRFDNDPEKFLKFMEDPSNAQEAVDLGLAKKRPDFDANLEKFSPITKAKVKPTEAPPEADDKA